MSLNHVIDEWRELVKKNTDSVALDVFTLIILQPNQIGPRADMHEILNLSNQEHKNMLIDSVWSDVKDLKTKIGVGSHNLIDIAHKEALKLLAQKDK